MKKFYLKILLLVFLSVICSLQAKVIYEKPIVFGDEGFHAGLSRYMAKTLDFPAVWEFVGNQLTGFSVYHRPPLWNLLLSSFYLIGGEFLAKSSLILIAFLIGLSVFCLISKLFDPTTGLFSAILCLTAPSAVTYAVLFYTDYLFLLFTSMFLFTFLLYQKEKKPIYLYFSFIFSSLCFLTKAPGFAYPVFLFLMWLIELIKKNFSSFKPYLFSFIILFLIISGYLIRNFYYFKAPLCYSHFKKLFPENLCGHKKFKGSYKFAGRTEKVGTEQNVFSLGLINYLDFAYGNIWLIPFLFLSGLFLLSNKKSFLIPTILFLLIYFYIFLISTARAEDTARYTLGCLPLISLIASLFLSKLVKKDEYEYFIFIAIFSLVLAISFQNFYQKLKTMALVKTFSPSFFEACDWVKKNLPSDSRLLTIWAYRALYNCERKSGGQIADISLSNNLTLVLDLLKKANYTHIFIQKFSIDPNNKHLVEKYDLNFVEFLESHPEKFVKVFENGPSLEQCKKLWRVGLSCDGNIIYEVNF